MLKDVIDGYVSADSAYDVYGVVLLPGREGVDFDKTENRRKEIIQERLNSAAQ